MTFLSVVMPVYGNGHLLRLTLDALTRQTLATGEFEVIVVDDGSEPPLEDIVQPFSSRLDLTFIRQENKGRSVARNRALDVARGEVVVFLDADQSTRPDFLARHRQWHDDRGGRPGVLLGRSLVVDWAALDALHAGQEPTAAMLGDYREDVRDHLFAAPHHRRDFHRAPWIYGHTNNASVDRASLTAVGGFEEALTTWGGEDNELFYRLFHHHSRNPDLFDLDEQAITYDLPHFRVAPLLMAQLAENFQAIFRKHPRYDIELFGAPGLWTMSVRRIIWFEDALVAARKLGLGRAEHITDPDALVIGFGAARNARGYTFDHDSPAGDTNLHLAGFRTPFTDGQFRRVVAVDLWRFLNPEDLAAFLFEMLRIGGGTVDFVATDRSIAAADVLPLPFVTDLEFLHTTVAPFLPVTVSEVDGVTTMRVGG